MLLFVAGGVSFKSGTRSNHSLGQSIKQASSSVSLSLAILAQEFIVLGYLTYAQGMKGNEGASGMSMKVRIRKQQLKDTNDPLLARLRRFCEAYPHPCYYENYEEPDDASDLQCHPNPCYYERCEARSLKALVGKWSDMDGSQYDVNYDDVTESSLRVATQRPNGSIRITHALIKLKEGIVTWGSKAQYMLEQTGQPGIIHWVPRHGHGRHRQGQRGHRFQDMERRLTEREPGSDDDDD